MKKQLIIILSLFSLGVVVGIAVMNAGDDTSDDYGPTEVIRTDNSSFVDSDNSVHLPPAPAATTHNTNAGYSQALEDKLAELEARVVELEQAAASRPGTGANTQTSRMNTRDNRLSRLLTTKTLIKAGLSEELAADIVRRRNDIELRKLELRDRASREGYLGTTRYTRELTALMEEQITLREELGDDAYDQYLYANGMPNRVKVTSVMLGSVAEEAGMKDGDTVLTYGQLRVFEWSELKNATSEGELGEYVNVDILRDGQLMSLWVPRGPLGVRLGSARVAP